MLLTAVLLPAPEGGFTALNPETGSTSQGETVEEAVANLREATELYLEEFPLKSTGQPLVTTFLSGSECLILLAYPAPRSFVRWNALASLSPGNVKATS